MRRRDREISDRESLRKILDEADACRLAFAAGDTPYIVALSFGYSWDGEFPLLYFHCAREGRKLDMMRLNPRVCFELDIDREVQAGPRPCDWTTRFASIVGYGSLRELGGDEPRRAALALILRHYGWPGDGGFDAASLGATVVLELRVDEICGKRKA
jgi:nitroimidazol reductase NimA-like FMN-containing flavoprotein (pyridoxamine 5'-phosphate oxidase superfamily)